MRSFVVAWSVSCLALAACSATPAKRTRRDAAAEPMGGSGGAGRGGTGGAAGRGGTGGGGTGGSAGSGGAGGVDAAVDLPAGGSGGTRDAGTPDAPADRTADSAVDRAMPDVPPDRVNREVAPDVNTMTADMACTRYAMIRCSQLDTCTMGYLVSRDYGTLAACQTWQKADCMRGFQYPWTGDRLARVMSCATATM